MEQAYPETFDEAWELLGDTPIDEQERIDEPYFDFPIGTGKYEIWGCLEEHYDISIGDYLRNPQNYRA